MPNKRKPASEKLKGLSDNDKKLLADEFWKDYQDFQNVHKVADKHQVSHSVVHNYLKSHGYKLKGQKFTQEEDDLIKKYYVKTDEKDFDLELLTKKLGRPNKTNVSRRARQLGLTVQGRPQNSETRELMSLKQKERIARDGHNRGALGLKHSEKTKEIITQKSNEYWQSVTPGKDAERVMKQLKTREKNGTLYNPRMKTTWKQQWAEVGGKRNYYRSQWELNYARYLEWLKQNNQIKEWEHEPETFWFEQVKRGTRSYLPDFRVTELNGDIVYHEVKGWMDDKSKTKIKRMAKYYPNVKLIVIDSKAYKALEKQVSKLVKEWS